jgi:hypothetical protein
LCGDTITLFENTSGDAPSFSGTFTSVTLPTLSEGLYWSESDLYSLGELQVVPENNTAYMLIGGAGVLLSTQRMRRSRTSFKSLPNRAGLKL